MELTLIVVNIPKDVLTKGKIAQLGELTIRRGDGPRDFIVGCHRKKEQVRYIFVSRYTIHPASQTP